MSKGAAVAALAVITLLVVIGWRSFAAWWYDDVGNLKLARGNASGALVLFERG
ncbi:MAG: hypothetical protein JO293_06310, partial [Candidatus Eremiobacteraeota bacterium]|nr:hypothetical protein [Candidatus Eremiobacteraeota bacterium]